MMQWRAVATCACLLAFCFLFSSHQASAQSARYSIEVRPTAEIHDSVFEFRRTPLTDFQRLNSGEVAVGPLSGPEDAIVMILDQGLRKASNFVRRGAGPDELSGMLVIASDRRGGIVAGSFALGRAKNVSRSGEVTLSTTMPSSIVGIGVCGDETVMAGVETIGGARTAGVFAARKEDSNLRLLHPLQPRRSEDVAALYVVGSTQMLSVNDGKILVAVPNRPEVIISDSQCRRFSSLEIGARWFEPWEAPAIGFPWNGPMRPTTYAVRWYAENVALLLTYRANPKARYFNDRKSRESPIQPAQLTVPLAETVLTAFDTRTGTVLAERVLDRVGWSFMGANELVHRRRGAESEITDVYTIKIISHSDR